jgi:hypothetical protein
VAKQGTCRDATLDSRRPPLDELRTYDESQLQAIVDGVNDDRLQAAANLMVQAEQCVVVPRSKERVEDLRERLESFRNVASMLKCSHGDKAIAAATADIETSFKGTENIDDGAGNLIRTERSLHDVIAEGDYAKILAFLADSENLKLWATGPKAVKVLSGLIAQVVSGEVHLSPGRLSPAKDKLDEGYAAVATMSAMQALDGGYTNKASFTTKLSAKGIKFSLLPLFLASKFG